MRKNWLLLMLATALIASPQDGMAQQQKERYKTKAEDPVKHLPYDKKLRWADDLFKAGSYFNAAEYYQQLKMEQPRNPYLTYQLAEAYWYTRDYVPAAHYFGEVYGLSPKLYPEAIFKQGMMLKMQGQYDQAIAAFNKFIEDNPKTFKKLKLRAKREIDGCIMGINSIKDPQPVNVKNAGPNVNSAYTESAPYPLGDSGLLFSTMNQNTLVANDARQKNSVTSRFMVSHKQSNVNVVDSFQWALAFDDGDFNDPRVHVGNGSYSPGGDRFYFTKCQDDDSLQTLCKIFVSKFEGRSWSRPELLGSGVNEDGSNTHPFVAMVGKKEILFFSSNRKLQSRGGFDIWYSIIDPRNGTYRRPQNAGKHINTEQDEITPYYNSSENKLYFASNGWVSMGGFDIFSAEGGPSRYTNLSNLGYPINTSADELYFIKDNYGKPDAYVVSNRVGSIALTNPTCCDDIWRIQYEPKLVVIGKVIDKQLNVTLDDVVVKMVNDKGDLKTYNSTDGNFAFNMARQHTYVITGDKPNYSTSRTTLSTLDIVRTDPDDTVYVNIYMEPIVNEFRVSNIYYDYDKATLRPESIASLDSLINFMKDNPSLSVEVYSYTDGKGTPSYNKQLSEKRAEAVIDYLVNVGEIESERMIAKGLGATNPAAANTTSGGRDNPEGRQLNRRTEFRIVTDVPERRLLFDSAKPGSFDEQRKNLEVNDDYSDESGADDMDGFGNQGSRVN